MVESPQLLEPAQGYKESELQNHSRLTSIQSFPLHRTGSHPTPKLQTDTNTLKGNVISQHVDLGPQTQPLAGNRISS